MSHALCGGRCPESGLGRATVTVAAVDIGTNTVRCLVADDRGEIHRSEFITGLGHGVDATGRLADDAVQRAITALEHIAGQITSAQVVRVAATSASRDAQNRQAFFDAVERTLGWRPELLSGTQEAELSFRGATGGRPVRVSTVVDVGGGSTEIITGRSDPEYIASFDIGSVRVTDRHFAMRPTPDEVLAAARRDVSAVLTDIPSVPGQVVGVGGTFQTLGSILAGINDGVTLRRSQLEALVDRLAGLTIEGTAAVVGIVPGRERVMLGGALVAATVLESLGVEEVMVSRRDLLDGIVAALLAQSAPG